MLSDDERHELERLVRMGRETFGPPSPRQELVARTIRPGAWSASAQEHVEWAIRHGRTGWRDNIGAQFLILRRLAMIQASEILRKLDRQSMGRADLPPLDAMSLSSTLGNLAMKRRSDDVRRTTSQKGAKAVFFLKQLDGIPAPSATLHSNGSVTLLWSERGRTATISIDVEGRLELSCSTNPDRRVAIDTMTWNERPWRLVTAATDWVHHDGPEPVLEESPVPAPISG